MSPETRAFLELVREAEVPAPGDELRVFEALQTAIVSEPPLVANGGAAKATTASVLSKGAGLKLLGALAAVSTSATLIALLASSGGSGGPLPAPSRVTARDPLSLPLQVTEPSITPAPPLPSASQRIVLAPQRSANAAPVPAKAPASASLRKELALLADVQAALEHGDGATALRRLDGHVTVDRQFMAERQAARILSLCALGREKEARDAAAAFLHENPRSVQRTAVERSCAGAKSTGAR